MSKIYEALRRHEQELSGDGVHRPDGAMLANDDDASVIDEPSLQQPDVSGRSQVGGRHLGEVSVRVGKFLVANREMQTLYRSVAPLIGAVQRGAMIMFSSAHPGEGKTTVCGSYAATLAQNFGKSVLILDADRGHTLTRQWGTQKNVAIAELEESSEAIAFLQAGKRVGTRGSISVIPIGSAGADSPELALVASIKDKLADTFNYILIDAPSAADASWSPSIASMTDGVVLVVEAERTRWPVALNAKQEFESSGAKVIGVFLNKRRFYIPPRIYRRI
jgi:Mrp family chromosome partitioning ATPase